LSKDIKALCELVGLQLTTKAGALTKEIADIEAEIVKYVPALFPELTSE
jgi:hypothetical protein